MTLPFEYDEVKCSWQNRINQGKVRLSVFRYTIIKTLQLVYSNLQWTESLSQKILISTCMHHHANAIFFTKHANSIMRLYFHSSRSSKAMYMGNWIRNPLFWMALFCCYWGTQGLYSWTVWAFLFTSTVAIFNHMWMQIKSPSSCALFLLAV